MGKQLSKGDYEMNKPEMKHMTSTPNYSKIEVIDDLVLYQDSSIVSREILSKKSGTVTLFAFDKGQGLSEHTAPFDAIVQIIDGQAWIKIGENEFNLKKGEIIIMPANVPHALKATERFKMILTLIKD